MTHFAKLLPLAPIVALALAGCGADGGDGSGTPNTPPVSSTSTGGATGQTVDVTPCLGQSVGSRTVAGLVVPDVIRLDMAAASGFPNGRRLQDPVVDVTLAVLFLRLSTHPATTFAALPLNPPGNDVPFPGAFPYLAPAQGNSAPPSGVGTGFVFRTDAPTAYTRVDRMGMPAVATALVSTANKTAYNDDSPAQDATGKWAPEFTSVLTGLTRALADDLTALKLTPCAAVS